MIPRSDAASEPEFLGTRVIWIVTVSQFSIDE